MTIDLEPISFIMGLCVGIVLVILCFFGGFVMKDVPDYTKIKIFS